MRLEDHIVRLTPGQKVEPGEYSLRDGASIDYQATADACPYCQGPLQQLVSDGVLRVIQEVAPPRGGAQRVKASAMPAGHKLLRCGECRSFFSTPGEAA